jgi:hypothetical protein
MKARNKGIVCKRECVETANPVFCKTGYLQPMQPRTNAVDGNSNSIEDIMSDKDGMKYRDLITGSSQFAARDTKFNLALQG